MQHMNDHRKHARRQAMAAPRPAEVTAAAATAAPMQAETAHAMGPAVAEVRVSLIVRHGSLVITPVGRAMFASPPVRCTLRVEPTRQSLIPPTAATAAAATTTAAAAAAAVAVLPIIYQCGTFGCTLPDHHAGLHRVSICLTPTLTLTLTLTLTPILNLNLTLSLSLTLAVT